jgi:uncharacterized damage-inducible protein DinB
MDIAAQSQPNIGQTYPWLNMTFDYTDRLAALIPNELLDWRYTDPSGGHTASLAELAMHLADDRLEFSRQLCGSEDLSGYWTLNPRDEGMLDFRPYGSKQAILDSLQAGRRALDPYLAMPSSAALKVTDGMLSTFKRVQLELRDKGIDTADYERRGPANVIRVLMAVAVHESGHRGALQTLLRTKGINLEEA